MSGCSKDHCENLVTKVKEVSGMDITSLLNHFDKYPNTNSSKYFENFKFFKSWLSDEYSSCTENFSIYETIESYLRIKEIQDKLTELEYSLNKKLDYSEECICPKCGSQIKLNPKENLWNILQAHQDNCAKYSRLVVDEDDNNVELSLQNQESASSSTGTSTSASLHDVSTSQSEIFDESSVNRYHKNWMELNVDQTLQKCFLPEDYFNAWCIQCAEKVSYNTMKQHLSKKYHQVSPQADGDASKGILRYHESVISALYNDELYNYTLLISGLKYFIIQNLGSFGHCIVCTENITDITNHLNSQAHKELIDKSNERKTLRKYHELWLCQAPHIQIQQKYFRKHHIGMICVLCSDTVTYTNEALKLHLESTQHRLHVLRNITVSDAKCGNAPSGADNSKTQVKSMSKRIAECVIEIISKSEYDMYPPILMSHVYAGDKSELFTVQLKSNRSLRCLVCQIEFIFDHILTLLQHVNGRKHKSNIDKTNSYGILSNYHNYWKTVAAKYSLMQMDFRPITNTITWCIKCAINLEYKHVHNHIEIYHFGNAKDAQLTELIHKDFKFNPCIYKANILKQVYSDNIAQFNIIRDTQSYPLIQTTQNIKKCVLCRCVFNEEVLAHLTSQKHIQNANNTKPLKEFKKYHDLWTSKKYLLVQAQQIYFFQKCKKLNCIVCACIISRKDLIPHIQSKLHKSNASVDDSSLTRPNENLSQDIPLTDADKTIRNKKDDATGATADAAVIELLENLLAKENSSSNNETGRIKSYDSRVESILYPKSLTKLVQELSNNNILTVRLHTNMHFCCLLCFQNQIPLKLMLKREVYFHIAEPKHINKYSNELMMSALETYHKNWMRISSKDQMLQIDFIPINTAKCRCLKCEVLLEYSQLEQHLKSRKHVRFVADQARFLSLIVASVNLEHTDPWKTVSGNAARNTNSTGNDEAQMDNYNNTGDKTEVFETNEISESESTVSSDDYDNIVSDFETDSFISFRETTESDPSESNSRHSDSDNINQQQMQEENFQLKVEVKYDKLIEETLYPDLHMGCIEIDGIKYPVFRILEYEGIVCTLCKGNPRIQSMKNHLEFGAKHVRRMNDVNVLSRLKRFHLFWMNQEASAQLLQKYFKTTNNEWKLKCCLCGIIILYEDCIEHVNMYHKEAFKEGFNKHNEHLTSQIASENSDSSSLSPATVSGLNGNPNDKYKIPDFNFQFKFEMKYDKSVEDILYPVELRKHFILIENIKYPIFRFKINGLECLICNSSSKFTSTKDHLNSPIHHSKLQEKFSLTKMIVFHDFWMNQEPYLQLEQKYFGILNKNLKCMLCDSEVTYEEIITHVTFSQHKKSAALNTPEIKQMSNINTSKQDLDQSNSLRSSPIPKDKTSPTNKKKNEHEIRRAVSNPKSTLLLERMPERYKNHLHFLRTDSENSVSCRCCCVPLKNELINLKQHLRSNNHINKSKILLKKFKFLCEICIKIYSSEESWEKHLKEKEHLGILSNLGKTRKDNIMEYECVTCSLVIFGDKLSLMRHQQWNKLAKKNKELKLPEGVRRLFESSQHIEYIAEQLVTEANHESQNQKREKDCCVAFVKALKEIYPNCRAYPFGSRVIGLGGKESDLDIFVDVDNMYTGRKLQSAEEQADIIANVKKILKQSKTIFTHINPVPTARTPIIQVFHVPTRIDCDVSFRHGLSVENTCFIRLCIDLQPTMQRVILVLKQWCKMCDLNNFSSYALTMMAIFYYQTQGYLLSLKELKEINANSYAIINGWETIKYTASLPTMKNRLKLCSLSVKELLHDFFVYFARYDYEKQVMCPLLGESILRTCFNDVIKLPPEMKSYVQKLTDPNAELFRNRTPICIQDPFDLSHNLTKACGKGFLLKWKGYCELSAKHLSALR